MRYFITLTQVDAMDYEETIRDVEIKESSMDLLLDMLDTGKIEEVDD